MSSLRGNAPLRSVRAGGQLAWVSRGFWAITDQGLFAVSNFLLSVLLARWLAPADFGAFSVAYSAFLFLGTVHTALVTEPMLVFGAGRFNVSFPAYLERLATGQWGLSATGAGLMALLALGLSVRGSLVLGGAMLATAVAAPSILYSWFMRRACFACLEPRWSAISGMLYLGLMTTGAFMLFRVGRLSPVSAMVVIGAASLLSGVWTHRRIRSNLGPGADAMPFRTVAAEHWRYGRWSLASSGLSWLPANLLLVLLPGVAGLQAAGTLRALGNLTLPVMHAYAALGLLLVPALAGAKDGPRFRRLVMGAGLAAIVCSAAYWVALNALARPAVAWLYHGRYLDQVGLLRWLGLLPLLAGVTAVLGGALRALERPEAVFKAYVAAAAVVSTVGLWCLHEWYTSGAVLGQLLASTATAAVLLTSVLSANRDRARSRAGGGPGATAPHLQEPARDRRSASGELPVGVGP